MNVTVYDSGPTYRDRYIVLLHDLDQVWAFTDEDGWPLMWTCEDYKLRRTDKEIPYCVLPFPVQRQIEVILGGRP